MCIDYFGRERENTVMQNPVTTTTKTMCGGQIIKHDYNCVVFVCVCVCVENVQKYSLYMEKHLLCLQNVSRIISFPLYLLLL